MPRSHTTFSFFLLPLFLAMVLTITPAFAFQISGSPTSASKVNVVGKLSVDKVPAGSTFKAAVVLTIEEGWHINSHTPTYDYLIGTTLELPKREGVTVADVRYPPGVNLKFGFADDSLSVYEKSATIFLTVRISEKLAAGRDTLRAKLEVQACNDQICIEPATIDVLLSMEIVPASRKPKQINNDIFSPYINERSTPLPAGGIEIEHQN